MDVFLKILTSKHENELPNAIRGSAGVQFVDKVYPFIWEDFERRLDYATLWNEDWPHIGKNRRKKCIRYKNQL